MQVNKIDYTKNNARNFFAKNSLSFGKELKEHKSWGGVINPENKNVSFKLFTYPDAKSVSVVLEDKNDPDLTKTIELENKGSGVFSKGNISSEIAKNGDYYEYLVTKNDGSIERIKDPYSFKQDEVNGPSSLYDQSEFKWKYDKAWKTNPERITRNGKKSLREARIYALSPDTITDKRSYQGVKDKLKEIKQMGFNTVEIMHIENTFSFNWGYDGVDKHAPSSYLGGPDQLKDLVDSIHKEGMNVVFDVVPNHLGPDGNQLGRSGVYVKGPNCFGDALNYEGENSEYVRDYMINAMLNWAENYHVDGLRLDMTKYMNSDYTLKQLAAEMNYHHPEVFLIAEDGRGGISIDGNGHFWPNLEEVHDKRITSPIKPEEYGKGLSQKEHAEKIRNIINNQSNISNLGMDAEWDFNFYHEMNESLYFPNTEGLIKAVLCSQGNVKYISSHDEKGNYEGTAKIAKLMVPKLMLNDSIVLSHKDIERAKDYAALKNQSFESALQTVSFQKAQFVSEALATKYQKGELEKYKPKPDMYYEDKEKLAKMFKEEVAIPLGINASSRISYKRIEKAFKESFEQTKMAMAFTYGISGPKMVFQGDENIDMTPFRFFRRFESVPFEDYLYTEKGYAPAESALEESTMGKIQYSKEGQASMNKYKALVKDLNTLNKTNEALQIGYIDESSIVDHPMSCVVGFNTKYDNNEIFSITNLSDVNYSEDNDNEYYIKFPRGKWAEILNTDDKKYGGTSEYKNREGIVGDGHSNKPLNIAKYSTIYFKRVG